MSNKILFLFFIIILLNITVLLNANEKANEPIGNNLIEIEGDSIVSFNFNNNFNKIVKFGDNNIDYTKKRRGMLALGGVGVGLFVSGFLMETGGAVAFLLILLVREPAFESIAESRGYDAVPAHWYMDKYIALIIASAGSHLHWEVQRYELKVNPETGSSYWSDKPVFIDPFSYDW